MVSKANFNKKYAKSIAYPTIALTLGAVSVYLFSIHLAINGVISYIVASFINSIMAYLLFTSMHEAGHLNISGQHKSKKWIDEVIGWIAGMSLIAPFYIFKVIHFRHHAHTNNPDKDPDHWLASKSFISLLMHATTIFPVYFYNGFKILLTEEKTPAKTRRELIIGYIVAAVMFSVIGGLMVFVGWKIVLYLYIIPAFIAQAFLAFAFDWLPHHPHEHKKAYLNTRVIDIPILSFFLLSQNYHLMHHLYPRIPFYHYKDAYDEIPDKIAEKGVEVIKF